MTEQEQITGKPTKPNEINIMSRVEIDPAKVTSAETCMWKAYYSKDFVTLNNELAKHLCYQYGLTPSDAEGIAGSFSSAAMKFALARSDYRLTVLPDIELAYSQIKDKLNVSFDPMRAASAELDWWATRRTPGHNSAEEIGKLISHLYTILYCKTPPAFERAGFIRAQAAHLRDMGGADCDWDKVEDLLKVSYQALKDGL